MAFRVKERVGEDLIAEREEAYIRRAIARLVGNPKVEILGNLEAPRLAVVSFLLKPAGRYLHPRFVVRLLSDLFGIQGRAGCSCAGPYGHDLLGIDETVSNRYLGQIEAGYDGLKPGWCRLSFHFMIDEAEFDFLLSAVEFLAEEGDAFLPLYDFDWRSGAWRHASRAGDGYAEGAFEPESWAPVATSPRRRPEDYAAYLAEARRLAAQLRIAPPVAPDRATAADTALARFQY